MEWSDVKSAVSKALDDKRRENDDKTLSVVDTAHLRGSIATLKWVLNLPKRNDNRDVEQHVHKG
jgi:hypothetical protein